MKYTLRASNESIATNTGAPIGFVVIKLPHTDDKQRNITEAPTRPGTATIARNMWPWTVASDYREPANQRLDMTLPLAGSVSKQRLIIRLGDG